MASGSASNSGRLPDFVIIGAMRAGSTTLARAVGAHPGVFMPAKKELHFFDWKFDRGTDWYREQFRSAEPGAVLGEATPIYIVYRDAMERLAATVPGTRLIAVLRDPASRAYSHYWYNRMLGFEPLPFREALAAEAGRPANTPDRRTFDYVERGRYLSQLLRVCELFPRDALHVLLLEDLNRTPAETYRSLFRFLGIDETFVPTNAEHALNSHAEYRSKALAKVSRALPDPLRRVARRFNRKDVRYPPMDEDVRRELDERFAEDNRALAAWLGRELIGWGRTGTSRAARQAGAE
ncbi:MAG: sulfotransferase domain-containing protein [Actinomycetota bacterium]